MVTDVWVVLCIHDSLKATQTNKLHSHNQRRSSSLFSLTRRAWSLSLVQRGVSDVHSVLWALGCPFTPPHADWRPAKASPPIHRAGEMLAGNDGQTVGWGPKSGRTILGFAHLFSLHSSACIEVPQCSATVPEIHTSLGFFSFPKREGGDLHRNIHHAICSRGRRASKYK